jgi:hypothetical protein
MSLGPYAASSCRSWRLAVARRFHVAACRPTRHPPVLPLQVHLAHLTQRGPKQAHPDVLYPDPRPSRPARLRALLALPRTPRVGQWNVWHGSNEWVGCSGAVPTPRRGGHSLDGAVFGHDADGLVHAGRHYCGVYAHMRRCPAPAFLLPRKSVPCVSGPDLAALRYGRDLLGSYGYCRT